MTAYTPPSTEQAIRTIAEGQHGAFSRAQAMTAGFGAQVPRRRAASGEWVEVFEGVYRFAATPVTWHLQLMAAVLWAGRDAVVSFEAAGALWRFDGFRQQCVVVSTGSDIRPNPGWRIQVHKNHAVRDSDRCSFRGIPVTRPLKTLFDLAGVVRDDDELEAAIDSALRLNRVTERVLTRWETFGLGGRGRRGTERMRRVLAKRAGTLIRSGSPNEIVFVKIVVAEKLPMPVPQYEIILADGRRRVVDFAYPDRRLIVELHGPIHAERLKAEKDVIRNNELEDLGWRIVTFTDRELEDPARVAAQMRRRLGLAPLLRSAGTPTQ